MTAHNVYYNDDYTACDYSFDTTRKSAVLADRLKLDSSVAVCDPIESKTKTLELINYLHDPEYVGAVMNGSPLSLAQSQGFEWDPKIPTMAIAHNSGLVAAVGEVMSGKSRVAGSLSSGLHHAEGSRGNGFCTFNGLAVSATHALDLGAERILVLDFDAHCGGGTRSMLSSEVVQIDVSTSMFDTWSPDNKHDSLERADSRNYIEKISEALCLANEAGSFDLVLYNAGMDPANSGVSKEDLAQRERMVAEWAAENGHKVVYALAGGYTGMSLDMNELVDLHQLTVDAFVNV
jgi:acetoin utilization deacetylase AcuC-like enzyme